MPDSHTCTKQNIRSLLRQHGVQAWHCITVAATFAVAYHLAIGQRRLLLQGDHELTNLIRRKFAIKCTTGYSLNALVDFPANKPIEIIKRLLVGSEGTLGFVSRATYSTVPEHPHKASACMVFPDVHAACAAASMLRDQTAVDAVELFDRHAQLAPTWCCNCAHEFTSL